MPRIEVELSDEELEDLQEYSKHHPDEVKDAGEALKQMAGLMTYRAMKQKVDPDRKSSPVLIQDIGVPSVIPCNLDELLKRNNLTYNQFLRKLLTQGVVELQGD